jgi:diguanylate cyclase (GGDEF)-like protein/PAS domain S-box-containing protein
LNNKSSGTLNSVLTVLNALRDALPDLIFYKDIDSVYLGCNQAFCDFVGQKNESDIIGKTDYDLFDHKQAEFFRIKDSKVINENIKKYNDEWVTYPDGREVLLNTLKAPFLDSKGSVTGILGICRDITEHHQAQIALQDSLQRYQLLFEASNEALLTVSLETGNFTSANQAAMTLFGASNLSQLTSIGPIDVSTPHQPDGYLSSDKVQQEIDTVMREGSNFFEWRYQKLDGTSFISEVSLSHLTRAEENFLYCRIHDISERKHIELLEKCRNDVMESMATDNDFSDILKTISLSVEQQNSDMLCSILLLDNEGKHLLTGSAPSLPDFYNAAIHGMEIGMGAGSCGTAAFTGKGVIVDNTQTHPYWAAFKELANIAGLMSCWSEPICSSQGKILGTFAIYHRYAHQPTKTDIRLIEQSANLASIAIEKYQAKLALKSSDERWEFAVEGSGDGVWDRDLQTDQIIYSKRWKEMLGYAEDAIPPSHQEWLEYINPEDRQAVCTILQDCLEGSISKYAIKYRVNSKGAKDKWILDRGMVVSRDNANKPLRIVGTHSDITETKEAEEQLKLAATVFTHARESVAITDITGSIIDVNDTFMATTGYTRNEVLGQNPRILQSGRQSSEFYADMWKALLNEEYWSGELWNKRKSGEVYAEIKTISAVRNEHGVTTHYVALGNDITTLKMHQEQLENIAHYDVLTNLPNRSLLADRLSQAMLQCKRHEKSLAVVFLDLDGFKYVNDTYGHGVGDELLIALSVRMRKALRESDSLARIGGDEFVAVLAGLVNVEDCEPVLDKLLLAVSEPITLGDIVLNVSASIGVTLYPQDNVDADLLMRHADQAMYVAKELGKNRYHLFDTAHDDAVKVQQESLEAVRIALDNHQFLLHYQPKVNMRTGAVIGVEALIRWQHPERGLLNPIEFLPIIENNPMSIELGEWVINSTLTQISQWQAMGINLSLSISVNIAAVQLQQPDFTVKLKTLLAAHPDVEPSYLELEVLETSAFDIHDVSTMMNDCIALGVKFAIDDFGTGYFSLTYLRRLPASLIKIDQTFVRDMLIDAEDLAIVEGVIALAKSFKRDVIAEGVETIEHGTALLQLGCELAQGYGIAKPMPASEIPAWINDWKPDVSW